MATIVELAAGVLAIVLGIAWVAWPGRMKRLQIRYLYFGMDEDDEDEQTGTEALIGRIAGVILAALGLVLALGLTP